MALRTIPETEALTPRITAGEWDGWDGGSYANGFSVYTRAGSELQFAFLKRGALEVTVLGRDGSELAMVFESYDVPDALVALQAWIESLCDQVTLDNPTETE